MTKMARLSPEGEHAPLYYYEFDLHPNDYETRTDWISASLEPVH
jgi:hypothetical protein